MTSAADHGNRSGNCVPWSAVVSSHDPVEAVLAKMPDGWAARISSADTLTAEQVDALKQRAGANWVFEQDLYWRPRGLSFFPDVFYSVLAHFIAAIRSR